MTTTVFHFPYPDSLTDKTMVANEMKSRAQNVSGLEDGEGNCLKGNFLLAFNIPAGIAATRLPRLAAHGCRSAAALIVKMAYSSSSMKEALGEHFRDQPKF